MISFTVDVLPCEKISENKNGSFFLLKRIKLLKITPDSLLTHLTNCIYAEMYFSFLMRLPRMNLIEIILA